MSKFLRLKVRGPAIYGNAGPKPTEIVMEYTISIPVQLLLNRNMIPRLNVVKYSIICENMNCNYAGLITSIEEGGLTWYEGGLSNQEGRSYIILRLI